MRKSENPSTFVPQNVPEKGQWFWIDVPGIAAACGLAPDTPLVEVQRFKSVGFENLSVVLQKRACPKFVSARRLHMFVSLSNKSQAEGSKNACSDDPSDRILMP